MNSGWMWPLDSHECVTPVKVLVFNSAITWKYVINVIFFQCWQLKLNIQFCIHCSISSLFLSFYSHSFELTFCFIVKMIFYFFLRNAVETRCGCFFFSSFVKCVTLIKEKVSTVLGCLSPHADVFCSDREAAVMCCLSQQNFWRGGRFRNERFVVWDLLVVQPENEVAQCFVFFFSPRSVRRISVSIKSVLVLTIERLDGFVVNFTQHLWRGRWTFGLRMKPRALRDSDLQTDSFQDSAAERDFFQTLTAEMCHISQGKVWHHQLLPCVSWLQSPPRSLWKKQLCFRFGPPEEASAVFAGQQTGVSLLKFKLVSREKKSTLRCIFGEIFACFTPA